MKNQLFPKSKKQRSDIVVKNQEVFYGQLGIPGTEITDQYSEKNVNIIDRGEWYEVRSGSKAYGGIYGINGTVDVANKEIDFTIPHPWETGDEVWLNEDLLSAGGSAPFGPYYAIYVDTNILALAESYILALAGTKATLVAGSSPYVYYGEINAAVEHESQNLMVWQLGNTVYYTDKQLSEFTEIINLDWPTVPEGIGMMDVLDQDVILASETGLFRIFLDTTPKQMIKTNHSVPQVLVTDVNESATLIYGYRIGYSHARLEGAGNRNRVSGVRIVNESGISKTDEQEKDFGEVFTDNPIDSTNGLTYETLTLPDNVYSATHLPVYRTKNIGENSGGVSQTVEGVGNRPDQLIWVDDADVAKVYLFDSVTASNVLTVSSGGNSTNKNETGSSITLRNISTGATITRNISSIDTSLDQITVDGAALTGQYIGAIGGGRLFYASQDGNTLTISQPAAGVLQNTDKGKTIWKSDGTRVIVKRWTSATQAEIETSEIWSNLGCTMAPTSGNFSRKYYDTIQDSGTGDGEIDLSERFLSKQDLYIPRRYFSPIQNGNIVVVANGFCVVAQRDTGEVFYSQIGDKDYTIGYHSVLSQQDKLEGNIRHMVKMPDICVILCSGQTLIYNLDVSTEVGRISVGESVRKLGRPSTLDTKIGVIAWQSIAFKRTALIYAFTNEPAIRSFDGYTWSRENFAIDLQSGNDAVQKKYIERIDPYEGVIGIYTKEGGYVIWANRWIYS